jgi:hypothetical protein
MRCNAWSGWPESGSHSCETEPARKTMTPDPNFDEYRHPDLYDLENPNFEPEVLYGF